MDEEDEENSDITSESENSVAVPNIAMPLSEAQYAEPQALVSPMSASSTYGMDIY